jgi:hypothetical protein
MTRNKTKNIVILMLGKLASYEAGAGFLFVLGKSRVGEVKCANKLCALV